MRRRRRRGRQGGQGHQGRPQRPAQRRHVGLPGDDGKGDGKGDEDSKDGKESKKNSDRAAGDKGTPKLPRARLTPATGSFTGKEKDYLVKRVSQGMDPAAVLEAGETACARIRTTAKASKKNAISALRTGEIDNAVPAVKHLCPKFAPLLKAAGKD